MDPKLRYHRPQQSLVSASLHSQRQLRAEVRDRVDMWLRYVRKFHYTDTTGLTHRGGFSLTVAVGSIECIVVITVDTLKHRYHWTHP